MIKKVYNRQKLRAKLALYIAQARKEYKTYLERGDSIRLAQAGEKLWGAFNYLMELRAAKSLKTGSEVKKAVYASRDNTLIGLYNDVFSLHQFFYGWIDRIEDIEERFKSASIGMDVYCKRLDEDSFPRTRRQERLRA